MLRKGETDLENNESLINSYIFVNNKASFASSVKTPLVSLYVSLFGP